jgi:hypothetical protein
MLKGLYLTLMVGPVVPVPVPQSVLDSLTGVTVHNHAEPNAPSGFEMTFTLSTLSPLHTLFLLSGGVSIPIVRVILIVTLNGIPEVVIDGVITKQDVSPGASAGFSTLTLTGVDLTALMDLIPLDGFPFPAMPPEARVEMICLKYAAFGIVPLILPSILIDVPIPIERIPRQQGTDLEYVYKLANDVGYVFFIMPGPIPGANVAYWGPDIRIGLPQPALNINMDAHTNVEKLSFSFDAESKVQPYIFVQNLFTKVPLPIFIPDITPLSPPLGLVPPIPKKFVNISGTAKLSPIQAALIGLAKAARSADVVSATGTLDVLRYGRILKTRGLVGVRGSGVAFDGLYYVKSVMHTIKRGEYKQSFRLTRNGLISTVPRVPA